MGDSEILSMTGFGRAEGNVGAMRAAIEVTSLNHRNRELLVHLPPRWSRFDPLFRKGLKARTRRGKVRVVVRIPEEAGGGLSRFVYRPDVVDVYLEAYKDLTARLGDAEPLAPAQLLGARGVVCPLDTVEGEPDAREEEALGALLGQALDRLVESRRVEGQALVRDLQERMAAIERLAGEIRDLLPGVRKRLKEKFLARVGELLEGRPTSEDRLLTEAALYVDRADVHEELVRLEAHVESFASTLREGGAQGRRLAFLGQEMNRESNTLGAKCLDPEASRLAVLLKDEVAKVREQVENLE
jgi:uncharacterized protein (TIGR00255 family)